MQAVIFMVHRPIILPPQRARSIRYSAKSASRHSLHLRSHVIQTITWLKSLVDGGKNETKHSPCFCILKANIYSYMLIIITSLIYVFMQNKQPHQNLDLHRNQTHFRFVTRSSNSLIIWLFMVKFPRWDFLRGSLALKFCPSSLNSLATENKWFNHICVLNSARMDSWRIYMQFSNTNVANQSSSTSLKTRSKTLNIVS